MGIANHLQTAQIEKDRKDYNTICLIIQEKLHLLTSMVSFPDQIDQAEETPVVRTVAAAVRFHDS